MVYIQVWHKTWCHSFGVQVSWSVGDLIIPPILLRDKINRPPNLKPMNLQRQLNKQKKRLSRDTRIVILVGRLTDNEIAIRSIIEKYIFSYCLQDPGITLISCYRVFQNWFANLLCDCHKPRWQNKKNGKTWWNGNFRKDNWDFVVTSGIDIVPLIPFNRFYSFKLIQGCLEKKLGLSKVSSAYVNFVNKLCM